MESERLARSGEVFLVPVNQIVVDESANNTRVDYGDIEALAKSIESSGLKSPISLKKVHGKDEYILVHGHRRMRAIKHLIENGIEYPRVKAFLMPKQYGEDDILLDMLTMNDGKPLSAYEQGLVFVRLINRGFVEKEICEKVGRSMTFVHNAIEMAKLPKQVQNEIAEGSISGLTAVEIFKISNDEDEAIEKVSEAIKIAKSENKKATARHAQVSYSPYKVIEKLAEILKTMDNQTKEAQAIIRVVNMTKMKEPVEKIFDTFE